MTQMTKIVALHIFTLEISSDFRNSLVMADFYSAGINWTLR